MNRQFCLTHTVRYDECNCDGTLTPAAFLRYMQELALAGFGKPRRNGETSRVMVFVLLSLHFH